MEHLAYLQVNETGPPEAAGPGQDPRRSSTCGTGGELPGTAYECPDHPGALPGLPAGNAGGWVGMALRGQWQPATECATVR